MKYQGEERLNLGQMYAIKINKLLLRQPIGLADETDKFSSTTLLAQSWAV